MYFSRNSHDYTETFGADIYSGSLTPFIFKSFASDAKNLILDGEMCAYNSKEKILLSKGDDIDVKSYRQQEDIQTCFCVFDILLYDDTILTNKPLKERIEYIKKAFQEIEGRIVYSKQETASTNQQVVDALNKAIDCRLEGIVVKDPESVYKPSMRGGGWFKVKPDYMLGLNDDLDLIVVGGYYGTGRRSGLLSHFLLAVALDNNENSKSKIQQDELDLEGNENEEKKKPLIQVYFIHFVKLAQVIQLKNCMNLTKNWLIVGSNLTKRILQNIYNLPMKNRMFG